MPIAAMPSDFVLHPDLARADQLSPHGLLGSIVGELDYLDKDRIGTGLNHATCYPLGILISTLATHKPFSLLFCTCRNVELRHPLATSTTALVREVSPRTRAGNIANFSISWLMLREVEGRRPFYFVPHSQSIRSIKWR